MPVYSVFYQKLPQGNSNSKDAVSTTPPHSVSPCFSLIFTGLLPDTPATCSVVMTYSHLSVHSLSVPPQQMNSCFKASCSRLQDHLAFVMAHLETVHCGKAAGRLLVTGSIPESRPLSAPSHTHCLPRAWGSAFPYTPHPLGSFQHSIWHVSSSQ